MPEETKEHPDYQIRLWALDTAIAANRKGTTTSKNIKDAKEYYGYLFPTNGKVAVLKKENVKDER